MLIRKLDTGWRRILSVLLLLLLLCECLLCGYFRPLNAHYSSVVFSIRPQLEEVWGPAHEDEPIAEVLLPSGPAAVRESLTFTVEAIPISPLPKLWFGAAALLTVASFFLPGSAALWLAASLCSLGGAIALPCLIPPNADTPYLCTVQAVRWIEGGDPSGQTASMTVTYRAYENPSTSDVSPCRIDWDSAETVYLPQEAVFNDLTLLVQ